LARLWVQRQVGLERGQQDTLTQDLRELLAWHRRTQLTPTADLLHRWQALANSDLSADQVCREWDSVRALLSTLARQALPGMTRLGRSLSANQRLALAESQQRHQQEFRRHHLDPTPSRHWLGMAQAQPLPAVAARQNEASRQYRLETMADRLSQLYGPLSAAQMAALRQGLAASTFDPQRQLAEQVRRSQDLQDTLARLADTPSEPEAMQLMGGWLDRLQNSPTPGQRTHAQAIVQESCEQWATVHRLATPAQRQRVVQTLADHEATLRQLAQR
jgi:hypothetical protein